MLLPARELYLGNRVFTDLMLCDISTYNTQYGPQHVLDQRYLDFGRMQVSLSWAYFEFFGLLSFVFLNVLWFVQCLVDQYI